MQPSFACMHPTHHDVLGVGVEVGEWEERENELEGRKKRKREGEKEKKKEAGWRKRAVCGKTRGKRSELTSIVGKSGDVETAAAAATRQASHTNTNTTTMY